MRAILSLALLAVAAGAEEIRVEVLRGAPSASVGDAEISARGGGLRVDGRPVRQPFVVEGPVRLGGRSLPGRVEIWADDGIVAVNVLDLEEYVAAVVASEMPAGWPDDALRAQAVAARSYAMAQKLARGPRARAHLGASVLDQVYGGKARGEGAVRAARSTAGEVLTYRSAPIEAFFSASCGGVGESGEAAFNLAAGSAPWLPGGPDGDADDPAPRLRWVVEKPLAEISAALREAGRLRVRVRGLEVADRTGSGRARKLWVRTARARVPLAAVELRQILGWSELPSLLFDVRVESGSAIFSGRGSGHGAGLCQWGARGRAARGEDYRSILAHYYPGTELRRMY